MILPPLVFPGVRLEEIIEIGLEHARFVVLVYFFPHLNMQKNLLIMGPNNTKNCSFSYLTMKNTLAYYENS